jgi:glycine C-acetyltransferase
MASRNPTAFLKEEYDALVKNNFDWRLKVLNSASNPHSIINGREVVMLTSNNYLNLATHPKLVKATIEAAQKYGAGAGAVPAIAAYQELQQKFEQKLAKFKGVEAGLLCQTGFAVNSGVIPQLVAEGDLVISDELNHGSIIDGVRLTKAERGIYKHNDMGELERVLNEAEKKEKPPRRIMIITDGVFSMDGDIAPLPEIAKLAEEHGAMVYVDDCHGEGVLGEGRGIVHHFHLQGKVHVEGGCMSKGFGVFGGTLAGSRDLVNFAYNKSRTWLLSSAHPPGVIAAAIAALEVVESEPQHVKNLWDNTNYFRKEVQALGFNTGNSQTPIIPAITGDAGKAKALSDELLAEGVFAFPIVFPMVAREKSRIRMQISANLTKDDLNFCLSKLEKVGKKHQII